MVWDYVTASGWSHEDAKQRAQPRWRWRSVNLSSDHPVCALSRQGKLEKFSISQGLQLSQSLLLMLLTSADICPSGPNGHLSARVVLPFCLCCGTQLCSPSPFHGPAAPTAAAVSQKLAGVFSPPRLLSMSSSFGPLGHTAHFSNSCFGCYPVVSQNLWHSGFKNIKI